jgi:hypothetical protein
MFSHNYFIEHVEEIFTDLHPKYYVKCIGRVGPSLFFQIVKSTSNSSIHQNDTDFTFRPALDYESGSKK